MAKETKAQRNEREAVENAAREVTARETYLTRLMALMQRAQAVNFELTVVDTRFVLDDRDDREVSFTLSSTYFSSDYRVTEELEWAVESKEEAVKEYMRKRLAKQVAMNKLTKEEQELLGL